VNAPADSGLFGFLQSALPFAFDQQFSCSFPLPNAERPGTIRSNCWFRGLALMPGGPVVQGTKQRHESFRLARAK
jgi:hypothetical protein